MAPISYGSSNDFSGANYGCALGYNVSYHMYSNVDEISEAADLILIGTVGESTIVWDDGDFLDDDYFGKNFANADTVIEVDEYLKGSGLSEIHVITIGSLNESCIMDGRVNPILSPGDQVLLFLSESERYPNSYSITSNQGYLIKDGDRYVGDFGRLNTTVDEVKNSIEAGDKKNNVPLYGLTFLIVILLIGIVCLAYRKKRIK
ncbi:hypothetical protein [Methanolapillus africanus]